MYDEAFANLSTEQLNELDSVCEQFAAARNSGNHTSIEQYLSSAEEKLREPLLRELLDIELSLASGSGRSLQIDDYRARFPDFAGIVGQAFAEISSPQGETPTQAIAVGDTDSFGPDQTNATATPEDREPTDLPREFGRYRLLKLLGCGGMGTVYLAHDSVLDRQVALKMPEFGANQDRSQAMIKRFYREARAMATVTHPNVCPIHDVGEHDGQSYLTMAYIDGQPLSEIIKDSKPLPASEAVQIVKTLAKALEAVHQAGIVHRDLKPANVMVRNDEGGSLPAQNFAEPERQQDVTVTNVPTGPTELVDLFITDFGLASRDAPLEPGLTSNNTVIGSPAYMAPEQVRAQNELIGPATDVYALGVILYELLCGRRPFTGSGLAVLGEITSGKLPDLPSKVASVDVRLEAICLKTMAHNTEDRYQTAAELTTALDEISQTSRVQERHDASRYRLAAVVLLVVVMPVAAMAVFKIRTAYGDVVVSAEDGVDVEIEVRDKGNVVAIIGPENDWQVRVEAGKYVLKLRDGGHNLSLNRDSVEVSRNGRSKVTILRRVPERVRRSSLLPPVPKPTKRSLGQFVNSGQQFSYPDAGTAAAGDLDGDGDQDLVIVNKLPDQPGHVWLNDGHGAFTKTQEFEFDCPSFGIALGDLDADGDLDVFVANESRTVPSSVWLNDGNGHFEDSVQDIGPIFARCVRLGDIDGDGDLDALTSGGGPLPLTSEGGPNRVWRNDGTGCFVDTGQRLGHSNTRDIQLADLDADGDLDALMTNWGSASRVWRNTGTGVFADSGQRLGGEVSQGLCAAISDVDADGDLDAFIVYCYQPGQIWINEGPASFTSVREQDTGAMPSMGIVNADLNGDQRDDFVIANGWVGKPYPIQVLLATDAGFTSTWIDYHSTRSVAIADFDADGHLDIFLGSIEDVDPLRLLLNQGEGDVKGRTYFRDSGQSLGNSFSTHVEVADLDADGDLDAFVTNYKAPDTVWWNDGEGSFTDSGQRLGSSRSVRAQLGDLDGDGDLDAFVPNTGGQPNQVYINDGRGVFRDSGQSLGSSGSKAVALGDFDNDGDLDAFVANWSYGRANRLYLNDGQAGFTDSGQQIGDDSGYDTAAADFDGDGDVDLLVVSMDTTNRLYLNDGDGVFVDGERYLGSEGRGAACADVDGDGDIDIFVANHDFNHVWLNDGEANFTDAGSFDAGLSEDITIADMDQDGDLDAFVSNNGINSLWHNDGQGVFGKVQWFGGSISTHAALADFDSDGDIDAFVTNEDGPNRVLLGTLGDPDR